MFLTAAGAQADGPRTGQQAAAARAAGADVQHPPLLGGGGDVWDKMTLGKA